jgi:hypothetical protein
MRRQLQESDLPYKARLALNDSLRALQDPKTRQAALDALESTGIPEKARGLVNSGVQSVQELNAQERAQQFVELAQHRAEQLPNGVAKLVNKPKPKRFVFV